MWRKDYSKSSAFQTNGQLRVNWAENWAENNCTLSFKRSLELTVYFWLRQWPTCLATDNKQRTILAAEPQYNGSAGLPSAVEFNVVFQYLQVNKQSPSNKIKY